MSTTPVQPARVEFVKAISRLDATALVVGSMIGSGIFIVSADILRQMHSPGLLLTVWILSGFVTLLGAITYGELAAMFPKAGGNYVYLREAISPLFGYLYGWTLFVVIQTGTIAAVAVAFARFTSVLVPAISPDVFAGTTLHFPQPIGDIAVGLSWQRLLAIASIALLTWVNVRGVRTAAFIQTSLTVIKTAALAGLIVLGLTIGRNAAAIAANFGPNFWAGGALTLAILPVVGAAMVGSLFSMDAWNNVGFAAGEMNNPEKDLPFAMAIGVLTVTTLYVLAGVAYLNGPPPTRSPAAGPRRHGRDAGHVRPMASTYGGRDHDLDVWLRNGLILSGARLPAMAQDNLFFKSAANLHPTYKTPALALIVQVIWTCVLCLSGTYGQLLNFVIFAAVAFYAVTAVGLFQLRRKRPDLPRPVRAPGYPVLPALYIVLTSLIAIDLLVQDATRTYAMLGLALVLLGVPVYYGWRRMAA
jgi:APA family basic amino acid/polyamine antiporter